MHACSVRTVNLNESARHYYELCTELYYALHVQAYTQRKCKHVVGSINKQGMRLEAFCKIIESLAFGSHTEIQYFTVFNYMNSTYVYLYPMT